MTPLHLKSCTIMTEERNVAAAEVHSAVIQVFEIFHPKCFHFNFTTPANHAATPSNCKLSPHHLAGSSAGVHYDPRTAAFRIQPFLTDTIEFPTRRQVRAP
jgi:hypothetical protein